jgi:hypothetical protein
MHHSLSILHEQYIEVVSASYVFNGCACRERNLAENPANAFAPKLPVVITPARQYGAIFC